MFKKIIVSISLLMALNSAWAAPGWVHNLKVCAVQSTNLGVGFVRICGAYSPKVCGLPSFVRFQLDAPNGPEMYSTALLALSLDKQVSINVMSRADCANTYDYIFALRVYK